MLTKGDGAIRVGHDMDPDVWRIDPTTLEAMATIDVGAPIRGMASGAGRMRLTTPTSLIAIDPGTDRIVATTRLLAEPHGRGPAGVVGIGDSIWTDRGGRRIRRVPLRAGLS